jgi:uncharacterized protein
MKTYLIKLVKRNFNILWNNHFKREMRMRTMSIAMISAFLLSGIVSMNLVNAAPIFPKPTEAKYVNDYANVIDGESAQYILSVGKELEDKTGAEATIVVIDSLEGETIESYSNGIFREWGIGQKDKNNGLLILLSVKERKWRVEVGTGLEGAVTDIYSSRVMNDFAVPKFKQNLYGQGFREAYSVLSDSIAKEYAVTLDKNINVPKNNDVSNNSNIRGKGNGILVIGIIVLVFFDFIFNRGRITKFIIKILFWSSILGRGGRRGGGGGSSGGGFGGGSSSGGGSSGGY